MYTVIIRSVSHRVDEPHTVGRWRQKWTRAIGKHQDSEDHHAMQDVMDRINAWPREVDAERCTHFEARVARADAQHDPPRPEMRARLEAAGVLVNDPGPPGTTK